MNEIVEYKGPIRELQGAVILHSDSAVIKARVEAPLLLEFEEGDQEMPEGVFIEFFSGSGAITATLRADKAIYNKEEDVWKATGNVVLKNIKNKEQLNTEELFWDPTEKIVYTEKFVRIESEDQIIMGEGLTAEQDFTSYKLIKPTGELTIEE